MAGNSKSSVVIGVTANGIITIAKMIGAVASGSSALMSEAIHSIADTGNQSLLLVGLARSMRPADEKHPYGYARERFFWGLVSALGIFFLGAGVTLYHGITGLFHVHEVEYSWLTWAVLGFSLLLESYAGGAALRGVMRDAKSAGIPLRRYLKEGRDPTITAVLLEDGAAVVGVLIAIVTMGLSQLTGIVAFDAVGSILVGLLLAVVALVLVRQNRVFLTIRSVDDELSEKLKTAIRGHDTVEQLDNFRAVMLGVDSFHLAADIDFDGRKVAAKILTEDDLAAVKARLGDDEALRAWIGEFSERVLQRIAKEVDALEGKVRDVSNQAAVVHLESNG